MSVRRAAAVVRRRRQPDRGDLASEERCLLAVAERHPQIDELRKPAGPRRRPAELALRPGRRRSGRAPVRASVARSRRSRAAAAPRRPGRRAKPRRARCPVTATSRRTARRRSRRTRRRPRRGRSGCAAAPAGPRSCRGGRKPRASSISAAVPDALSFAPGPVPRLSRWARNRIEPGPAPGTTVTRLRRRTLPSPGIVSSQASSTVARP